MAKIKERKSRLALCFSVACVFCLTVFAIGLALQDPARTKATGNVITQEVAEKYFTGESLTIPDVKISYSGKEYDATNGVLQLPDGSIFAGETYTFSQAGVHTLIYSAETEDFDILAEKEISVVDGKYSVSSIQSSFEFKDHLDSFKDIADGPAGLEISLADGDTFTYNNMIELDRNERTSVISFAVGQEPNNGVVNDVIAQLLTIQLTDCYDPNRYIQIVYDARSYDRAMANAEGQDPAGLSPDYETTKDKVYINGQKYVVSFGSGATNLNGWHIGAQYTFYYDYATNEVGFVNETSSSSYAIINQLSNPDIYGEKAFGGFTTGEVYLSIFATYYLKTENLPVQIFSIGNRNGGDLAISESEDNKDPEIFLIDEELDQEDIFCVLGEEFRIPEAYGVDINLVGEVSTSVVYCGSDKEKTVPVSDGFFTPLSRGRYKIIYSVRDAYGNIGVKELLLSCAETENDKSVNFSEGTHFVSVKVGENLSLPSYTISGRNKNIFVKVYAESNSGKRIEITKGVPFVLEEIGDYIMVYEYGDDFYSYRTEYEFTCEASDVISFGNQEIVLPRYFIKSAAYSLNELFAYSYADGKKEEKADFSISFDGSAFAPADVDSFEITGNEYAIVRFSKGSAEIKSGSVPIVDVGYGDEIQMAKYFVGNYISDTDDAMIYHSSVTSGNNALSYVGQLNYNTFDIVLQFIEKRINFSAVNLILTDYYDRENKTVIRLYNDYGTMWASIDGGKSYLIRENFMDTDNLEIDFASFSRGFTVGGVQIPCETDFATSYILFDLELEGIEGQASIKIRKLNNQVFNTNTRDLVKPEIYADDTRRRAKIGSEFTIARAYVSDVLSPFCMSDLVLTVTDPDGDIVTSTDGVVLNENCSPDRTYEVVFEKYGYYDILYIAKDGSGNEATFLNRIFIEDAESPSISFERIEKETTVIEQAGEITLEKFTVSDNISSEDEIYVSVSIYDEWYVSVYSASVAFADGKWGESVCNLTAGNYTVYVYAADEAGNAAVATYKLRVE